MKTTFMSHTSTDSMSLAGLRGLKIKVWYTVQEDTSAAPYIEVKLVL